MKSVFIFMALISAGTYSVSTVSAQTQAPAAGPQIAGPVLMVTDLERSLKFYTDGLGLQVASRLPGKPGPGAVLTARGTAGSPFILLRQRGTEVSNASPIAIGEGLSRVMIQVPDAAQAAARLNAAGFNIPNLAGKRIFFATDPDGYRYEIMQVPSGK
jgi:catechol 2,3-dioxygenase-like lactoylglutathione lyase family enzyme